MLGNKKGKMICGYVPDYVLFDLETTGTSCIYDEVIEISAVKVRSGKVVEEFSQLVNPKRPIPYAASMVNHISDEMVANEPDFGQVLPEFLKKHASRLWRRYVYNYFVRDFNVGTLYSLFGVLLLTVGTTFGAMHWLDSALSKHPATSGTVMLAALPVLIGIQFLIAFLHYDVSNLPTDTLSNTLAAEQPDES